MEHTKGKIDEFFLKKIGDLERESAEGQRSFRAKFMSLLYLVVREVSDEQIYLRSMSLVYTTLLSLVPLLAVSFSVLKAFGAHTRIEIFLYYILEPLGPKGIDLSLKIIGFVENVKVSILGSVGLVLLVYAVLSAVQKMESSLNYVWHIKGTRSITQRFSNYLSVLIFGPVLLFAGLGITVTAMNSALMQKLVDMTGIGPFLVTAGKFLPFILVGTAFTLLYMFLTNTRVYFSSAVLGGAFAGLLWLAVGRIFSGFIVSSAKYSAIYSGFALIVLFLIWLYWSFIIILLGAKVSFYKQHPHFLFVRHERLALTETVAERLALSIMYLTGYSFYHDKQSWHRDSLADYFRILPETIDRVLSSLERKKLIVFSGDHPPNVLPGRDIETISLQDVIDSVRWGSEGRPEISGIFPSVPEIDNVVRKIDTAMMESLKDETVKDLVVSRQESS